MAKKESLKDPEQEFPEFPLGSTQKLPNEEFKKKFFLMKGVEMKSVIIHPVKMKMVRMKNITMK